VWRLSAGALALGHMALLVFIAVVLASVLRRAIDPLSRFLPRTLATLLVALAVLAVLFGLGWLMVPILSEQGRKLVDKAPAALDRLQAVLQDARKTDLWNALAGDGGTPSLRQRATRQLGALASRAIPLAFGTLGVLGQAVLVAVLALFIAHDPRAYQNGIVRLVPKRHTRDAVLVMRRMGDAIDGWTFGTLMSMTAIGALTTIGLLIIGVESWLVLGLLNFFGAFVPYVGAVMGAVPGVAMGFAQSTETGLLAILVYFTVQQIEGNLLQPFIMKRAVRIQPATLLFWQALLGTAFGFAGVFVATPLLATAQVAIQYLYVERALGKSPGGDDR
jgi:predicted PurR-regulated permease PerM